MYVFQNYRLFFGLYSKNIATFWEFGDYIQGGGPGKNKAAGECQPQKAELCPYSHCCEAASCKYQLRATSLSTRNNST